MSRTVALREIAHARAGDKGNRSSVSVFALDPAHYGVPGLSGLNFVMDDALEGGVNESLNLDGHGKSWSSLVLGLTITLP